MLLYFSNSPALCKLFPDLPKGWTWMFERVLISPWFCFLVWAAFLLPTVGIVCTMLRPPHPWVTHGSPLECLVSHESALNSSSLLWPSGNTPGSTSPSLCTPLLSPHNLWGPVHYSLKSLNLIRINTENCFIIYSTSEFSR